MLLWGSQGCLYFLLHGTGSELAFAAVVSSLGVWVLLSIELGAAA